MRLVGEIRAWATRLRATMQGPVQRERDRIRAELRGVNGLLQLIMRERNGARWTPEERTLLFHHLRQAASLSPYLIIVLAPGSMMLLPGVAWWLDRRRLQRCHPSAQCSPSGE